MVGFIDKKLRIIVAGSRGMTNRQIVYQWLDFLTKNHDPIDIVILDGKAKGPDTLGGDWARSRGIDVWEFPALWTDLTVPDCIIKTKGNYTYNSRAGMQRNMKMGDNGTHLVAFNLGVFGTKGTNSMISYAKSKNLVVKEVTVLEDEL